MESEASDDETEALEQQLREARERATLRAARSEVNTLSDCVSRQEEQLEALRRELSAAQESSSGRAAMEEERRRAEEEAARELRLEVEGDLARTRAEAAAAAAAASQAEEDLHAAQNRRKALAIELRRAHRAVSQAEERAAGARQDSPAIRFIKSAREKLARVKSGR